MSTLEDLFHLFIIEFLEEEGFLFFKRTITER